MRIEGRLYLHGLLLLLSLFIPLFFFMLLSLNVGNALYTMLFLHNPFIFWLLILPLKDRFLDIEEIDLYAGVSSKLMFLTIALPGIRDAFRHASSTILGESIMGIFLGGLDTPIPCPLKSIL